MTAEREAMTLAEIRDAMREWTGLGTGLSTRLGEWSDAIDAHLSRTAEPVYQWRRKQNGEWRDGHIPAHIDLSKEMYEERILFTHPSEDGREVTNEMVLRAVHASLDWPHPLTHFEARKVLEAVMAEDSRDGD